MSDIYLTASEVTGKPGMQGTVQGVNAWMNSRGDDEWLVSPRIRPSKGRGRPSKELHISCFPIETQAYFAKQFEQENGTREPKSTQSKDAILAAAWENYSHGKQVHRDAAQRRTLILRKIESLLINGSKLGEALDLVAKEADENPRTIERWRSQVNGHEAADWVALLMPRYGGGRPRAKRHEQAWKFYKANYLRQEKPTHEYCYRLLQRTAAEHGWRIASSRSYKRWINELDKAQVAYLREGEEALHQMYPSQERTRLGVDVLHTVNCDGYKHNVFVRWPDGTIRRPITWFVQDFYSGRIISHRTSWSENTEIISGALLDILEIGVPKVMILDNTRSAANKQMTGGVQNRYRDKLRSDEPLGKLPILGIDVKFTSVYSFGGSGQSKPIERAFKDIGGLGEVIDKHPLFAGAWTGRSAMDKPENYNPNKAIPIDKFLSVKEEQVAAWNAQPKRRSEVCGGKLSFDEAFAEGLKKSKVMKASKDQRALVALDFEAVTVQKNGTFTLNTGRLAPIDRRLGGRNRYYNASLVNRLGESVIAWVDPRDLHAPVQVRELDGTFFCEAICLEKAGHTDKDAAREHNNKRSQWKKANKQAAKALNDLTIQEAADMIPAVKAPTFEPPKVIEIMKTPHLGVKRTVEQKLTPEQEAQHQKLLSEFEDRLAAQEARKAKEKETSTDRIRRWLRIDDALQEGVAVSDEDKRWWGIYQGTSEHKAEMIMIKTFGRIGYLGIEKPSDATG